MKNDNIGFKSKTIHHNIQKKSNRYLVNVPVYHGSTVVFSTLHEFDHSREDYKNKNILVYGRLGTPTTFALEELIADMENGFGGLAVSSGLSAVTISLLSFLSAGDHLLIADTVYGPTRKFCDTFVNRIGVEVTYYDPTIGSAIENLIQKNTRCLYMESPGSLTFEVQDVPTLVSIAKRNSITTIMDNTWASPYFYRPLDHGVNVSVTSATKYIVGHSDAMLGLIVSDETHYAEIRSCRTTLGHCVSPDDIYLGIRGAKTLCVRMEQHHQNALELATWLQSQPDVIRVIHPAFSSCPGHEFWKRDFDGASSLFSFEVERRDRAALASFLDNLKFFSIGLGWGGYGSLVVPINPELVRTATTWKSDAQLIRLHVGLEDIDDLKKDIELGLKRYRELS